jgi:hypothetical protein
MFRRIQRPEHRLSVRATGQPSTQRRRSATYGRSKTTSLRVFAAPTRISLCIFGTDYFPKLFLLSTSTDQPQIICVHSSQWKFDLNRTPIAPPGTRVLVLGRPSQQDSWSSHASDAWYVGPAMDSYRCYLTWMVDTRALRISDTAAWLPSKVTMPTTSSVDLVIAGAKDIVHALQNPSPGFPLALMVDSAFLSCLSDILLNCSDSDKQQQTPAPIPTPTVPPGFDPLPSEVGSRSSEGGPTSDGTNPCRPKVSSQGSSI